MLKQILSPTEAMFSFLCATSSLDHAHEQSRGQKDIFNQQVDPSLCSHASPNTPVEQAWVNPKKEHWFQDVSSHESHVDVFLSGVHPRIITKVFETAQWQC